MNRRIASVAAAAFVVGGFLVVVVPQHATSVVRLLAATVAVVAGGLVLASVAPVAARQPDETELDRPPARAAAPLDPHGLRDARRDLDRPAPADGVPAPVWERLHATASVRLQRAGADLDSLSPQTQALLTSRPRAAAPAARRDPQSVARAVHRTLDELDSFAQRTGGADGHR